MRAVFGQAGDNVAIKRTVKQKELLIREIEETLSRTKSAALRLQLKTRVANLRSEIRTEHQDEEKRIREKAQTSALRHAEADARRRPHRTAV